MQIVEGNAPSLPCVGCRCPWGRWQRRSVALHRCHASVADALRIGGNDGALPSTVGDASVADALRIGGNDGALPSTDQA